jgi:hypothetical protein
MDTEAIIDTRTAERSNRDDGFSEPSVMMMMTKDEAEVIVHSYLSTIASIQLHAELGGSFGTDDIRAKWLASDRIDDLVESGLISHQRVKEISKEAFKPLQDVFDERQERIKQIASAVGGTVEDGQGKLGTLVFESGGELHAPDGKFFLNLVGTGESTSQLFGSVADAADWVLKRSNSTAA